MSHQSQSCPDQAVGKCDEVREAKKEWQKPCVCLLKIKDTRISGAAGEDGTIFGIAS